MGSPVEGRGADGVDVHRLAGQALSAAAEAITGIPGCPARPGQEALAGDVVSAMLEAGHLAGVAPTGTGKGLAYGVPAALFAALRGERTVVSTESKALQAQLVNKDLPTIVEAVAGLTGVRVSFAVHQGFGNYGCTLAAAQIAADIAGVDGVSVPDSLSGLAGKLAGVPAPASVTVDGRVFAGGEAAGLAGLAGWVLGEAAGGGVADRAEYDGVAGDAAWERVSTTPEACLGSRCRWSEECPARRARARAADADIVVANHALLALQAANGVPVVVGNRTLGVFDHLVVDEAHALPGTVRSSGARRVTAGRVRRLAVKVGRMVESKGGFRNPAGDRWVRRGRDVADLVEDALAGFVAVSEGGPVEFTPDTFPLSGGVASEVVAWLEAGRAMLAPAERRASSDDVVRRVRSARYALAGLADDLDAAVDPGPVARWVEREERGGRSETVACVSPVDVSAGVAANLFSRPACEGEGGGDEGEGVPARVPLSVVMVSATMPDGFCEQVGLRGPFRAYPSPFADAYARSLLFVPRITCPDELALVGRPRPNGRSWILDVRAHREWVAGRVCDLVAANGGSALVLAATSEAGRLYADALRGCGLGVEVLSQWDGPDPRRVVAAWRDDVSSVLVGTRSMMTGVDASGESCSLVVVDRVPRNPGNVVDDARARLVSVTQGVDRWSADRAVYAADAALLLAQAAGRLIRGVGDSGMVAVLDPRLMKGAPMSYPEPTRRVYMAALSGFAGRTGSLDAAVGWLAARREWVAGREGVRAGARQPHTVLA